MLRTQLETINWLKKVFTWKLRYSPMFYQMDALWRKYKKKY